MSALDTQVGGGHYKNWAIQPAEFNQKNQIPYCEANVIKYVCRHKNKNGVEDLKKAIHYIELLMEMEYGESEGDNREPTADEEGTFHVPNWRIGEHHFVRSDHYVTDADSNTSS